MSADNEAVKVIIQNRRARHDYHIVESIEAGIVLTGEEIKSIRAGEATIAESYIRPQGNELFLVNAHIRQYSNSGNKEYDPVRPRKLLLHRREIEKLTRQVDKKGFTLVALDIHLKDGRAKVEVGVAKGKSAPDKRESVKDREAKREMARTLRRG